MILEIWPGIGCEVALLDNLGEISDFMDLLLDAFGYVEFWGMGHTNFSWILIPERRE